MLAVLLGMLSAILSLIRLFLCISTGRIVYNTFKMASLSSILSISAATVQVD